MMPFIIPVWEPSPQRAAERLIKLTFPNILSHSLPQRKRREDRAEERGRGMAIQTEAQTSPSTVANDVSLS